MGINHKTLYCGIQDPRTIVKRKRGVREEGRREEGREERRKNGAGRERGDRSGREGQFTIKEELQGLAPKNFD